MELDFGVMWYHFYHILIAFTLTLPIALNREYRATGAGLRTFPLVAIATCAFMLVGMNIYNSEEAEARVLYGIITGMGFIGGGAIFKQTGTVSGTASAAGLWVTGAIGIAVAYRRYEIALILSFISFVIFQFAEPVKKKTDSS
ncbi:MgtC/SapB family protein [Neptunicella sp. SCSIO 80796]|uniref:MgtC/SapB family protein n=1 Tax=Neptunicella plasticusilytica TaxID=3117012 RepID=UPI003A4D4AFF